MSYSNIAMSVRSILGDYGPMAKPELIDMAGDHGHDPEETAITISLMLINSKLGTVGQRVCL